MKKVAYIGMDVHKETVVVAISWGQGAGRMMGTYPNNHTGVSQLIKEIKAIQKEGEINICYEAGPCGYALKRIFTKHQLPCEIIAPSLIPIQSGRRIKTDKRDAIKLANLYSGNQLTFITVPNEAKEGVRTLVRCRENFCDDIRKEKQRINHLLLLYGYTYPGTNWTQGHLKWLKGIVMPDPNAQDCLEHYIHAKEMLEVEMKSLDKKIEIISETEEYKEKVNALCAFRGIGRLTAMILIAEVIDFSRFSNPRELMSYLGLVPSEYSSGGHVHKGSITKTGNNRARRVLIEASWHYRHKPMLSERMKKELSTLTPRLREAPEKAMKRLNKRYHHLSFKGKTPQKVVVAVARELTGFVWDSMTKVEQKHEKLKVA